MKDHYASSTNPCKLCTPLGAALAFHGIEGAVCLLHGSQGCSTYIRRYLISHFKEPLDVASTNFSEHSAVFGGRQNFLSAVRNLNLQYQPSLVGVATTCLAETMGEDLSLYLHELSKSDDAATLPPVVTVSTAAYRGTHADGFHDAVKSLVVQLADPAAEAGPEVLLFSPMVSPSDLRALKDWLADFGLVGALVPDWSETLDGGPWSDYTPLPPGGTPLAVLRSAPKARASIELGRVLAGAPSTACTELAARHGVAGHRFGWPLGVRETDRWFDLLSDLSGKPIPMALRSSRARLLDALVDGHKVVSGLRVAVYGEEDLVVSLAVFLAEIGAKIVAVASGGASGRLRSALEAIEPEAREGLQVLDDSDFFDLEAGLAGEGIDLLIGSSKGFKLAQARGVPLVRVGFPVHDRFGGARIRLLGYDGALALFDQIVNAVLEKRQADNPVGYTYY